MVSGFIYVKLSEANVQNDPCPKLCCAALKQGPIIIKYGTGKGERLIFNKEQGEVIFTCKHN